MGFESVGVETASYGRKRFPHLTDQNNRPSHGIFAEVLESKELKIWAGANRADPYAFGAPMATQAGERSKSEGTHSSSQYPGDNCRFDGASSLFSTDIGHKNRTISVSELLAFRKRVGKVSNKQMPTVFKDSFPTTSSPATVSFFCGGTTVNGSTHTAYKSLSNSLPKLVNNGPPLFADGRESSSAVSKDSICAISSFASLSTSLRSSTSCSSSVPFVFSAGATGSGPLKPGTQSNAPTDRLFSGPCRSPTQSSIPRNGFISGKSRSGVQPKVALDSSISGSMSPALHTNLSRDSSFLGSSQPTVKSNVFSGNLLSVPIRTAAQVNSSVGPSYMGSLDSDYQSKVALEMQSLGLLGTLEQSDIPFEALLTANTAQDVVGGMPLPTVQGNRFAENALGASVGITRMLNELDIDSGINLPPKLGKLDFSKDGEWVVNSFAGTTEVEQSLKNLNFDKRDCHPRNMEKLADYKEGNFIFSAKNTSVIRGQSTCVSGVSAPNIDTFVFGATKARTGTFSECPQNKLSEAPSAPNSSFAFQFSPARWEVKPLVSKIRKDKFRHRPLRPGLRSNVKGKNSESTSSTERPELVTPIPSGDGVSMDISPQSTNGVSSSYRTSHEDLMKPLVPEYNEGESDEESAGASNVYSTKELKVSILKLRAEVSELNVGPGIHRTKLASSSKAFSNVEEQEFWLCRNKNDDETSISANDDQGWKRTPAAYTLPAVSAKLGKNLAEQERGPAEEENDLAQHSGAVNVVNERGDVSCVTGKNSSTGSNGNGTEASSGPDSSICNAYCQPKVECEGKGSPFTFTASPAGMSTSSLRRRTRKVLRSVGRVNQADNAPLPVLQPEKRISRPMSTMKFRTWSDTASLGGVGGSGYQEGVNAQGVIGGVTAAEQVCERWRLRGNQAYSKGDFVKAEEFYTFGVGSVSPHETSGSCRRASMLCYSNRAATRMVVGRMREAIADCMQAMAVEPSFVRVHLRAAGCHLALGETELAASAFNECLKQAQAASTVDSKVLADASDGLQKAQLVAEYCSQARKLVLNNSSGDSTTALLLLNEALLASPQSEWLLELKAYTLISLQRYTEAVQVCEQSLALAERNLTILEGASNRFENFPLYWRRRITVKANFHLGKLEETLELLEQLQRDSYSMFFSDPDLPGALSAEITLHSKALVQDLLRHKLDGNRAFQAGNFAEALEHYTAALARNGESRPFCAVCLCNRAAASQALGHIADAIADCSRAIALDPLYVKAISRRASLHEKVRDYGPSCCDLGRLIAIFEKQLYEVQGTRSLRVEELQQAKERLMKAEDELKKGFPLDHYGILGIELGCSASEIKKAYRKAALRHHPDKAGQFLLRSGDTVDDHVKDAMAETVRKNGDRLIDEVRKDSEQLFKLIGEAYAVLSDPAKRSRYDSEEELRKFRTRSSDLAKNVNIDRKHSQTSDGASVNLATGGWSNCSSAGESGSQSRASRQRERWEGFNYQYQRWHPGPDAAQPDVYARRGRPTGSTFGSARRCTSWRWEEYPWNDV